MRYTHDGAAWGLYLRESPDLRSELHRRAQIGLAVGRALAPRRSGDLAASGKVVDDGVGGAHRDRMQLSVVFDVIYAASATFPQRRNQERTRRYLEAVKAVIEAGS